MPPEVQVKEPRTKSRKKTARACNHCHKAHMTCDETRPCKRCVVRGLETTCVDAPRKKKKYLMDVPDDNFETPLLTRHGSVPLNRFEATPTPSHPTNHDYQHPPSSSRTSTTLNDLYPPPLSQNHSHVNSSSSSSAHQSIPSSYDLSNSDYRVTEPKEDTQQRIEHFSNTQNNHHQQHPLPSTAHRQSRSKFMSSAANNEYSILSHIINQDDIDAINMGMSPSHQSDSTLSPQAGNNHVISRLRQSSINSNSTRTSSPTPNSLPHNHDIYNSFKQGDKSINQYMLGFIQDQLVTYPQIMESIQGEKSLNPSASLDPSESISLSFSIAINESNANTPINSNTTPDNNWGLRFKEPEDIYAKIDKPFPYTPGFHSLIHYLRSRFNRTDLIQMAKSMASYRPSFIACTNTLKEEDLIFMEQCFQRTLLEYDKFISISGTPTIVWRRTGQIAYVSEEFSILTGWTREQLLNKITFIVELMDDSSVIEYFDLFSTIAYGDFKAATMGGCTLLTPDRSTIRTTCIWTLKRDVFGIPMMIIGNFLPIV